MLAKDGSVVNSFYADEGIAPLSAFAAAKAWRQSKVEDLNDSESERDINTEDDRSDEGDPLYLRETEGYQKDYESSSEKEGVIAPSKAIEVLAPAADPRLSTWTPKENNVGPGTEKVVSVCLSPNEVITFIGQYDLWVKTGAVTVYGATLLSGRNIYRVFAPSTHALPQIKCLPHQKCEIEVWQFNDSLRILGKLSLLFRRIWSGRDKVDVHKLNLKSVNRPSFAFLSRSADDTLGRFLQPLDISIAWQDVIRNICTPRKDYVPKIIVCGPRGSGKSTFGRVLLNYLVSKPVCIDSDNSSRLPCQETVCVLDLDPGQPEFTPPGQISLVQVRRLILGPPFTHPYTDDTTAARLVRAHSIAAISPKDDPERFLSCVTDLVAKYENLLRIYSSCPLIVNCPGYVLGSGLELTNELIRLIPVTDIVYMSQSGPAEVVDALRQSAKSTPFHLLPSQPSSLTSRTATEFRAMQYMSYFHQNSPVHGNLRWSSSPLNSRRPHCLKYGHDMPDILGIWTIGGQPASDFLCSVLDGSLVAICIAEDDVAVEKAVSTIMRTTGEHLPYWPHDKTGLTAPFNPSNSSMIGLACVFQIDVTEHRLRLQTPISPLTLAKAQAKTVTGHPRIFLIRGSLDTPGWAYQEQLHLSQRVKKQEHKENSVVVGSNVEDIFLDPRRLPQGYDNTGSDGEEFAAFTPWVKKLLPGEAFEKKWRNRHDLGRHVRSRDGRAGLRTVKAEPRHA